MKVALRKVKAPQMDKVMPIELSDVTVNVRKNKVLSAMKINNFDKLVIYGDVEHGSNFEYLIGYFPRFEEAL